MTGPENWREAEALLEESCSYGCPHSGCIHETAGMARAQVHATLALTAAIIAITSSNLKPADRHEWQKAIDPEYAAEVTQ